MFFIVKLRNLIEQVYEFVSNQLFCVGFLLKPMRSPRISVSVQLQPVVSVCLCSGNSFNYIKSIQLLQSQWYCERISKPKKKTMSNKKWAVERREIGMHIHVFPFAVLKKEKRNLPQSAERKHCLHFDSLLKF